MPREADYLPALRYERLTALYDPIVRWTTREQTFKAALVRQAGLQPGWRVLDVGCGTATLTLALQQAQPQAQLTGLDGDPAILHLARAKTRQAGLSIIFDEALSDALPYSDAAFEVVVSSLFFHHLTPENKRRTLAEIWRVLWPGGVLHVADWGRPAHRLMRWASLGVQLLDGFATTSDSFAGRLPAHMQEAGFAGVTETQHFNTMFGTLRLLAAHKPATAIN
jgi:ubiquinone/menaquinone biosynthesis C-methylase UbiE